MSRKFRVGIIGFGHMHINNVAQMFGEHPQVQWVACADTVPVVPELREAPYTRTWNFKHALEVLGVPKGYSDYREMLEQEKFDIMIVTSENAQHPDIVEACAAKGVHVCVEKPMAANLPDALRMWRACQAAGTTLLTNWPTTYSPNIRKAKQLIDEGVIGRVIEVKWRSGHVGPLGPGNVHAGVTEAAAPMSGPERGATWWHQSATGGGALLDYCCYGAILARWFVGEPAVAAMGIKANLDSQWGNAEDNAIIVARFPSAIALLEGSWTTRDHGVPTGPIIYGQTGTLVIDYRDGKGVVRLERGHKQTTIYEGEPIPEERAETPGEFIYHLETGEPLHPTLDVQLNLDAQAILDAGIRSAASGKLETVNNATWCIG
jgi:predicted dehydrogenase